MKTASAFQVRNIIMYTVVGAILLVALRHLQYHLDHHPRESRDIAIMKSLGLSERTVRACSCSTC